MNKISSPVNISARVMSDRFSGNDVVFNNEDSYDPTLLASFVLF